jgi:hypothetical protein
MPRPGGDEIFCLVRALLPIVVLLSGCKDGLLYRLEVAMGGSHHAQATSITPITSFAGGSSGITGVGDRYDVTCAIAGGTATLYPAVHNGSSWTYYPNQPCVLDSSVISPGTCAFGAHRAAGLTWNALKTGAGTVSACTAMPTSNLAPVIARPASLAPTTGKSECPVGVTTTLFTVTKTGAGAMFVGQLVSNQGVTQLRVYGDNGGWQITTPTLSDASIAISAGGVVQYTASTQNHAVAWYYHRVWP